MSQELIDGLLGLSKKVSDMEKGIGMPLNTLSSILKGTRTFPPKWVAKTKEYIAINQVPKEEKFTQSEIEKKLYAPDFLTTFLLKHPNQESVRIACLHYLGDNIQIADGFMRKNKVTAEGLIAGYNAWTSRVAGQVVAMQTQEPTTLTVSSPEPKISLHEVYKAEILKTTYSGDLQRIMKEIDNDNELGAVRKATLRAIANEHRTTFTN